MDILDITEKKEKGSLLGGILLVAGCCIGAGMLGLPILSAMAGFKPSIFMFILSWIFMLSTGLLLLEVNLWFKEDINIVTMAGRTLGKWGKVIAWVVFLFLFYCLMVAYSAGSGALVADFLEEPLGFLLPSWVGSFFMVAIFGVMIYLGTKAVDEFNRLLMLGLILSYILLVVMGTPHVNLSYLAHENWGASLLVIPAMIVSFGFHNLVPSLTTYLNHDIKRLRWTLIIGSAIPLIIYLVWEWLLLGLIPVEGKNGFKEAFDQGDMTTRVLKAAVGSSWIVEIAHYFAFFAVVTSFLAVALSFVDFLSDGLHVKKTPKGKIFLCLLALMPPFLFALIYPKIFLVALGYAGGFGAVILFGLLPVAMAWSGRYIKKLNQPQILPGGKFALILIVICSLIVILLQLKQELGGG